MTNLDAWLWLLLLAAMLGIAYNRRASQRVNSLRCAQALGDWSARGVEKGYWALFSLALIVGIAVRLWRFPELPRGLYHDEAMNGAEALSLLRTGTDQYGTPWPVHFNAWKYGQMSALLPYLSMGSFALFGVSRLALRLPLLIMSLLALPVMWDLARRALGKKFALLALWMLAICPWQIVQARWALDCNTMGHMMLFAAYFLLLGLERKPFLYLSMVFFGLTMYAYGVALYTVPVLLLLVCVTLLKARRIRWYEAAACAVVYLIVAAPFLLTMAINFFQWKSMRLGPLTLEFFPLSQRSNDILLFSEKPLDQFMWNLKFLLQSTFLQNEGDTIAAYFASRSLYPFSIPAIFAGVWLAWRYRRAKAGRALDGSERRAADATSLMLWWVLSMVVCGLLTNYTTSQRSNAIFYPLLFCLCFALYGAARRVRAFAPAIAVIYALGFVAFCMGYFGDASYIGRTAALDRNDLYGALQNVREMDCDRFYIYTNDLVQQAEVTTMVAHELDGAQLRDEKPVHDIFGGEDYFSNRYEFTDFAEFEPDPEECAAYVIRQEHKPLFDPEAYLIEDFDIYATVYPRYWLEEEAP